jgi:hypothetical protein
VLILPVDAFPSSEAFDAINDALTSSDAERKDAVKKGQAVFAFTLKNKAGETESWHIDLKNKGEAGKGLGEKPTGERFWDGVAGGCANKLQSYIAHATRPMRTPPSILLILLLFLLYYLRSAADVSA